MKPTQPTRRHTLRKKISRAIGLALVACALAGLTPAFASGGTFTWNGGGGDGNWTTGGNWGGTAPSDPQNFLNFNGATRTINTNNFASGSPGHQIYFKNGANAFTLYGNSIFFYDFGGSDPNIQNEGAFTNQTINFPIANGNNAGTFHVLNLNLNTGTAQGPLTFNGTVSSADASQFLRVVNVSGSNTVTFNGVISDFGTTNKLALSQLGSGTTTLRATNTFTGDTTINAGTLVLATNSALANSTNFIRLGDTAATGIGANLNLNGGNNLSTSINVRSGSSGTKIIANTSGSAGNATFAGNLFLDADATLFANSTGGNTLSGGTLDLKNQTLTGDGTGSNVISGVLTNSTGSGKLVKNNSGILILSGNNTYNGATTVNAGSFIGRTTGSISNSAVTIAAGATNGVQLAAANGSFTAASLTFNAGTTYADFNFNGFTPSATTAPLAANGNLTFNGTLNVMVRTANIATIATGQYPLIKYTGTLVGTPPTTPFTVPTGVTAVISNNVANKSIDLVVTVGNTVTWAVGNAAWDINTTANWKNTSGSAVNYLDNQPVVLDDTASGASPITVSLGVTVTPASITANLTNKNYTLSPTAPGGVFTGSGTLTKNGAGTLTVSTTNSACTGSIFLNGGTLALPNGGSLGSGTITMSNATTLSLGSGSSAQNPGNPISVGTGASVTFSANTLSTGPNGQITSADSAAIINVINSITFGFNGNQTAFLGTVNVSAGTLRIGISGSGATLGMGNAAFVVNSASPGLQPRNSSANVNLGSLSGGGQLGGAQSQSSGTFTATYIIGNLNTSTTFSGQINQGGPTNIIAVTKVGTGTLTLSGVSAYAGATAINAGALIGITGGSATNTAVTVASGATNGVNLAAVDGTFTISNLTYSAGTCVAAVNFGGIVPSTNIAPLQVAGSLVLNGTLNVLVTGGSTTIPLGTYPLIAYGGALSGAGTVTQTPLALPNLIGGYITNDTVNKMIALVVTNVTAPPTLVWSAGTGTWDFSSLNWAGGTTAWSDTSAALLNDTASGAGPFTVTLTTNVAPIGVTFSNLTKDYTLAGTAGITGTTPLTKTGTGTLTIANSNTFAGATTISAGTLSIGNGGTSGSLANMAIVDNGALVINHSDAVAISSVISGTGSFTNAGGGTTTVSVTNTYAGNTTVKSGTLQMTDSGNLAPASTLVLAGGQFTRAAQSFTPVKSNAYKFGLAVTADSTVATTSTTSRTVHFDSSNISAVPGTTLLVTNAAATGTNRFRFYGNGFTYAGNIVLGGLGANNFAQLESYNTNDTLPDQIFTGVISGSGRIYKNIEGSSPGGNLIISNAANTFAGGTELRAGYIGLGANNPLGTNSVIFGFDPNPIGFYAVDAARTLANDIIADANSTSASTAAGCTNLTIKGSQNLTLSGRILIATNVQFFTVNNSALTTFSGVISNAAANSLGIAKQGSGTLTLAGNNAYNGDTFANVGILRLGAANVIPDGAGKGNVVVADTLDLNTFSETINGLSGTGIIDTIAGGTPILTVGGNDQTSTFTGGIKNSAGTLALIKTGTGTLSLHGTNTYSGGTTVNGGTISATNSTGTAGSSIGSGSLTLNSGSQIFNTGKTVSFTNVLILNGGQVHAGGGSGKITFTGPVSITGTSPGITLQPDGSTSGILLSGPVTNAGFTLSAGGQLLANGNYVTLSGPVSGTGIIQAGNGQLFLTGTNSFSGTLRSTNAAAILSLNNANAALNATLDANAADSGSFSFVNNLILGALTGSRNLTNNFTSISIGNNNSSTTYGGVLSGTVSLTKTGTGTLTFSGANTYSGGTTVSAGELVGSTGGSCSNSAFTVSAGATNGVAILTANGQWACGNLTESVGSYVDFNFGGFTPSTTTAPLQVLTNLNLNNANIIVRNVGGTLATGQYPLFTYAGTVSGVPSSAFSLPTLAGGASGVIVNNVTNKSVDLLVTTTPPSTTLYWATNSGNWDFVTANWTNYSTAGLVGYADNLNVILDDTANSGGNNSILVTNSFQVTPASVTVNLTNKSYSVSGSAIAGSGSLTKNGSGTFTLANTNTYTGVTTIGGGTLQLGDGVSRNGAVAGSVTNNGSLTFANPNTQTFSVAISGSGSVTKNSTGTLNLGGNFTNTYTGLTTVNAGTLGLNSTAPGTNAIGGNLLINSGATVTYTTARDEQMPDTANITNNAGTLSLGARTETVYSLNNLGGTNLISSGALFFNGGGYSTNGYFNCTSSGIMQFSNNLTVANGFFDITYASTGTAGYRILGPDNTGLIITANATTATTFTNQGNASTGARFLFGPASGQAPVTQVFTSVINVQDIPGVDPDLNMGLILTKSSGFNGNVRKDGLGKMALSVPASSSFTITNFIVNEGTLTMVGAGALYAPQNLVVNAGATLDFTGVSGGIYGLTNGQTFKGNGIIVGTLTNGNSTLAPGDLNSNGLLTVTGNLTNGAGAKLLFDIGGITPATPVNNDSTNYDFLSVSGTLALGGSLSVNLLGGFTPAPTDSFTIITNGSTLSGAFANLVSGSRVVVSNNVAYSFQVVTMANAVILTNFSLNAPSVVINPASTNIAYGNSVTLTANVGGGSPFTYQWYDKNTNAISGGTNAALTLNTPPVSASGNYRVIVANPFGTATNSASVTITQAVSSVAISSSSNPSGYLGALTFTANVTPTNATGTVTFFNGPTPFSTNSLTAGVTTSGSISTLARGTNTITAIYGGDINCFGNTNSLAQVVTNHAPTVTLAGYYRGPTPTWRIRLTDLVTNATDVDSDALTVTAFGTSTNGITLTTDSGFALYYNTNLVNDQFTYTVDDGFGGIATGTVNLTAQAFITGQNATVTVSGSTATVNFAGIPGFNYTAQRSTNLVSWASLLTTNAPAGGLFQVIDDFSDLGVVPSSAYYRLIYNP